MAAPLNRLLKFASFSHKNSFFSYSRCLVLINPQRYLKLHTYKNNSKHDNENINLNDKQNVNNSFLTYTLAMASALGVGYSLYKRKNEIHEYFYNNSRFKFPTLYAKTFIPNDISKNRDKYNFIADVVEVSAPSVVYIEIKDHNRTDFFSGMPSTTSNGSGFIVSEDGLILTNAHVVINKPRTSVKVRLHDGSTYTGHVEDIDLHSDLATVRINKKNLPVMKLGNSSDIRPGEFVVAIGSPLSLSNTITSGVVSSANRMSEELGLHHKHMGYIQTDAAITFGNSGGPLVNLNGEAIGINAMKVTAGISFAIPIDYAKDFLKKAEARRKECKGSIHDKSDGYHVKRRYLGITMLSVTPEILYELQQIYGNIPNNMRGVLVWKVMIGSPAYNGGLKSGDIITHVDGIPVTDSSNIYNALEKPDALVISIFRNGDRIKLRVEPEDV